MRFEWDDAKARANLRKHGIDFADAATVFDDESALTIPDTGFDEDRYVTMAVDALGRVLVVVYTWSSTQGGTTASASSRPARPGHPRPEHTVTGNE